MLSKTSLRISSYNVEIISRFTGALSENDLYCLFSLPTSLYLSIDLFYNLISIGTPNLLLETIRVSVSFATRSLSRTTFSYKG